MNPRLLNLRQGAHYLGVSFWTIRDYVLAGYIPSVQLPPLRPREGDRDRLTLRRVLVDVRDLDAFVDGRKSAASAGPTVSPDYVKRRNARPGKSGNYARDKQSRGSQITSINMGHNSDCVPVVCPD
jgi:hypothetical protein